MYAPRGDSDGSYANSDCNRSRVLSQIFSCTRSIEYRPPATIAWRVFWSGFLLRLSSGGRAASTSYPRGSSEAQPLLKCHKAQNLECGGGDAALAFHFGSQEDKGSL